ncbi:MAG: hypothetical protein KKC76_19280 [Proteobacteria bacterium]|nr:hypothetical protein [Pseudomonadota bacterium]MBU4296298.1 hypothetical protein [Pseudomonadota bacterium]MCG2748646.1 hypothetical protein [Desulfobulbaceae bacterium]
MKRSMYVAAFALFLGCSSLALAGNGYMGGQGTTTAGSESGSTDGGTTSDGPLGDKGSEQGELFGDLYVIDRYLGGETKLVPAVDSAGEPIMIMGDWIDENGNPVIDPSTGNPYQVEQQAWNTAVAIGGEPKLTEAFGRYTIVNEDTGEYEINPITGDIYFAAPYPSQCVQPVADTVRWGDISSKTGLPVNHLPLIIAYDSTWERTECEVESTTFLANGETWDGVTYYSDILYNDLVQEVDFGRLNLGRAPDAVLDQAFDEAISSINNSKSISLDASGRLLLTTDVYDEFLTNPDGTPVYIETVTKAIDSPLENLALYIKLMKDGHLITPADERSAIDRSTRGGIPLWKLLELEDGPSQSLRPTIDIAHMQEFGLGNLVDAANPTTYWTHRDEEGNLIVSSEACEGCEESYGITTRSGNDFCNDDDFAFSATFVASAADKTGSMTMDKVVYINSILGINLVIGYSEYDENGDPAEGAISYSKNPVYFNYGAHMGQYNRQSTFSNRGNITAEPGGGIQGAYDGTVTVLVEDAATPGTWVQQDMSIFANVFGDGSIGQNFTGTDITGFTAMSDDDLHTIGYIHTYQIPGLR